MGRVVFLFLVSVALVLVGDVKCEDDEQGNLFSKELREEGRTFVHHAMKRFAIILPAIFFKLGIAFTMLVLVTIVAVNNGFIGFMLLVVGLSTALSRFQEQKKSVIPVPIVSSHFGHHQFLDRSDEGPTSQNQADYNAMTNQIAGSIASPAYSGGVVYTNGYYPNRP